MSLGGGKSQATDDAVNAAVAEGVTVVVAAGNENKDCDTSSPARAKDVITVGATTLGDERAYFSNFGKGIDINAPGLNILSIWNTGPTSTNTIS
jgi:cerevisin